MNFFKKRKRQLPGLTVVVCTFNQESTVVETLNSVMSQQVDFPIQILVHDDCSTDNSLIAIYRTLANSPFPYKVLSPKINQYQFGMDFFYNLFADVETKYIAVCDGDDLWTDPLKLQKQIQVLEADSKIKICHHKFDVVDMKSDDYLYSWPPEVFRRNFLPGTELAKENFIGTCAVVFRRDSLPKRIAGYSRLGIGDYPLWGLIAQDSPIAFVDESMAKYRLHPDQVYANKEASEKNEIIREVKLFVAQNTTGGVSEVWKKFARLI
jgi:glycosyltransferase involved in cell wall biosynthesis